MGTDTSTRGAPTTPAAGAHERQRVRRSCRGRTSCGLRCRTCLLSLSLLRVPKVWLQLPLLLPLRPLPCPPTPDRGLRSRQPRVRGGQPCRCHALHVLPRSELWPLRRIVRRTLLAQVGNVTFVTRFLSILIN